MGILRKVLLLGAVGGVVAALALTLFAVEPISTILIMLAAKLLMGGVIILAILTFEHIINWFRDRQGLMEEDKDNIAFTVQDALKSGQYTNVQGIFNSRTATIVASRAMKADKVDDKLAEIHKDNKVALYS